MKRKLLLIGILLGFSCMSFADDSTYTHHVTYTISGDYSTLHQLPSYACIDNGGMFGSSLCRSQTFKQFNSVISLEQEDHDYDFNTYFEINSLNQNWTISISGTCRSFGMYVIRSEIINGVLIPGKVEIDDLGKDGAYNGQFFVDVKLSTDTDGKEKFAFSDCRFSG